MSFVNWVIDTLASEDVIDLYFVPSDLADINLTEAEAGKIASYDALATATVDEARSQKHKRIPLGKLVL